MLRCCLLLLTARNSRAGGGKQMLAEDVVFHPTPRARALYADDPRFNPQRSWMKDSQVDSGVKDLSLRP